jgi:ribonuclease J
MNTTACIYREKLYLIDAGLMFSEPSLLGISGLIPDISPYTKRYRGVEAYIITHGHEDHIGGLPFFYKKWPAPIYATPWTCALIQRKFLEHGLPLDDLHRVFPSDVVKCQGIDFTYLHMPHSIPEACSVVIETPEARVVHSGDFKIEQDPIDQKFLDKRAFRAMGKKGVDLLITDSTNAQQPGRCPEEKETIPELTQLIAGAKGRCFVTTFASNLWRMKILIDIAKKLRKKIVLVGRGMKNTAELAIEFEYIKEEPTLFVSEEEAHKHPGNRLMFITSGSQGERRSALWRITAGEHRFLKMTAQDTVIFSARIIPGNEKSVFTIVSELERIGTTVFTPKTNPKIHVSGHGYQEELTELLGYLKPQFYMPVHGGYSQLCANQKLGRTASGLKKEQIISIKDGDLVEVSKTGVAIIESCPVSHLYIEQDSPITLDEPTLAERLKIGEQGLILITGCYQTQKRSWKVPPDFTFQGLAIPRADQWIKSTSHGLGDAMGNSPRVPADQYNDLAKNYVRSRLSGLYPKKPIVISKISIID